MNSSRHESPESGDPALVYLLAFARPNLDLDLLLDLDLAVELDVTPKRGAVVWRPAGRFWVRLTQRAARLLPPLDQALYRELYHSELTELAQGSHPYRAQLAYTIRVVVRVLPLRRTLRAPAPCHPTTHLVSIGDPSP
jgi:hypothetical protein